MSKRTSAELSGFKNDLHAVRCEPGQTPQATTNWIVEAGGRPETSCFFLKVLTRVAEIWLGGLPALEDVYYLVPYPPSPLANEIMGLAGFFCFGL